MPKSKIVGLCIQPFLLSRSIDHYLESKGYFVVRGFYGSLIGRVDCLVTSRIQETGDSPTRVIVLREFILASAIAAKSMGADALVSMDDDLSQLVSAIEDETYQISPTVVEQLKPGERRRRQVEAAGFKHIDWRVLRCLSHTYPLARIGETLNLSQSQVRHSITKLLSCLGASNRDELQVIAREVFANRLNTTRPVKKIQCGSKTRFDPTPEQIEALTLKIREAWAPV